MFPKTTVVFLIPARGITTFQAQHGQKCSDRACPCQDHSQAGTGLDGREKALSLPWIEKLSAFASVKNLRVQCYIQRSKHQGNRAEQLNQHVERWTGGILERITDSIANHACLVRLALLTQDSAVGGVTGNPRALLLHAHVAGLDGLLGIVPSTPRAEAEDQRPADQCCDEDHDIREVSAVDCAGVFERVEHIQVSAKEQEGSKGS